ncbi:MAG TPA: hypothetical protein VM681_02260 [Candidatus Thermoplasmatota archaeon]|nr:hypothetical protein [Candidatus Thermoplasmatota archaeon]
MASQAPVCSVCRQPRSPLHRLDCPARSLTLCGECTVGAIRVTRPTAITLQALEQLAKRLEGALCREPPDHYWVLPGTLLRSATD